MAEIIIIEDDQQFRETLKSMLDEEGHQVREAPNGKVALQFYDTMPASVA